MFAGGFLRRTLDVSSQPGWELCPLCLQELAGHSRIAIPSEVRGEEKQPSRSLKELADVTDFLQETLVAG